jgi:hypothetical protein
VVDSERGVTEGPMTMICLMRAGWLSVKFRAMRQPREFWAMSVAPLGMLAWAKRSRRSDVKEEMLRGLRGSVGERPWPSKSKRWHLCFSWSLRWWIRGVKDSFVSPRPWMKTIGGVLSGPRVR